MKHLEVLGWGCGSKSSRYRKGFLSRRKKALAAARKVIKSLKKWPNKNYRRIPGTSFGLKFQGHRGESLKYELTLHKKARSILRKDGTIYVPEVYGVVKYRGNDILIMEHISGRTPARGDSTAYRLDDMLRGLGVCHGDLHKRNVIIESKTKEIVVIDWEYAYFD